MFSLEEDYIRFNITQLQSVTPVLTANLEVKHKIADILNVTFVYPVVNVLLHVRNMQTIFSVQISSKIWSQNLKPKFESTKLITEKSSMISVLKMLG